MNSAFPAVLQILTGPEDRICRDSGRVRNREIIIDTQSGYQWIIWEHCACHSCAVHSTPSLAYLDAVLKGKPRENRKAGKLSEEEKQKIFEEQWGGTL